MISLYEIADNWVNQTIDDQQVNYFIEKLHESLPDVPQGLIYIPIGNIIIGKYWIYFDNSPVICTINKDNKFEKTQIDPLTDTNSKYSFFFKKTREGLDKLNFDK